VVVVRDEIGIQEHSLGWLYFAKVDVVQHGCRVHGCSIFELGSPWHRGKSLVIPIGRSKALMFGLWVKETRRKLKKITEEILQEFEVDSLDDLDTELLRKAAISFDPEVDQKFRDKFFAQEDFSKLWMKSHHGA
jgi:hypothetical protein